jgi:endo-1,4-beta-mannosidase
MTFELGINYWPRRTAMWMWREFDIGEVRDDMARIAGMGFDVVRYFAMTRDFLTGPMCIAPEMVERLGQVALAAKDAGLESMPTLITINMSGRFWWPDWMIDANGKPADLFSDPAILRSQALLVETCARSLAGDVSIRAFDLSNEIDDAQRPMTRDAGWLWASLLANTIRRVAPGVPVQIGAHLVSLTTPNYLRIDDIAGVVDEDVMHAYPLYCKTARSFLDPELVPFCCALTAGLAGTGRRVLMQEFGLCTAAKGAGGHTIIDDFLGHPLSQYLASEEEAATYYSQVIERLYVTGASGAYAWSYADYDSRLFDRSPISTAIRERTFGLVRADGSEKPIADVFRKFRARRDAGSFNQSERVVPNILDVTSDEYYKAPQAHFDRLYAKWIAGIAS